MNKVIDNNKIDCVELKKWLSTLCSPENILSAYSTNTKLLHILEKSDLALNKYSSSVVKKSENDKTILDIRTYICANGICKYHNNRQHRRITIYNYNKMISVYMKIDLKMDDIVNEIIYLWIHETGINNSTIKYMKYVKESIGTYRNKSDDKIERYKPIESIFNKIDKMAEENSTRAINNVAPSAPLQSLQQINNYRMTYGDINYLGSNKAIFYFDRGIRGKQSFTNSMYPLKQQPEHKDIVIIDDIVFTSNCKCDSTKQHIEMFPHYRVTCAVGLTCPARLSGVEKFLYARDKNAAPGKATTARSMLIRYW